MAKPPRKHCESDSKYEKRLTREGWYDRLHQPRAVKSIIHVNRQHIALNAKDGGDRPVYTIKQGSKTLYAREVVIDGPSRLVYNGEQLRCGARAWIETDAPLILLDEMTFGEARASA